MVFAIECDRGELSFELGCWLLSVKNSNVCCGKSLFRVIILNCRVIKMESLKGRDINWLILWGIGNK